MLLHAICAYEETLSYVMLCCLLHTLASCSFVQILSGFKMPTACAVLRPAVTARSLTLQEEVRRSAAESLICHLVVAGTQVR